MTKHIVLPPSKTFHRRKPGTRTKFVRCGNCCSVQLKIKCYGRNHLDGLAIHPNWFCTPLLYGVDRGIGERRIALQELLHFDAAIFHYAYLKLDDSLQARALRQRRIGRLWRIEDALLKFIGILADASPELSFQIEDPPFEPVGLKVIRWGGCARVGSRVFMFSLIFGDTLADSLDLLADKGFTQSNLRIQELQANFPSGAA